MKLLKYYKTERPDCRKCNNTGRYHVIPMPTTHMKLGDNPFSFNAIMGKETKVYCNCEWGKDLQKAKKDIDNLSYGNPLKLLSDDDILKILKPYDMSYFENRKKPENYDEIVKKNTEEIDKKFKK